jgi:hypothetical protein
MSDHASELRVAGVQSIFSPLPIYDAVGRDGESLAVGIDVEVSCS